MVLYSFVQISSVIVQKPSLPKGTRDFGPEKTRKRDYIISKIKSNFIKYGFQGIETPTLENLSVLTGKYGDEGDQLLFKVLNSGDFLNKVDASTFEKGSKEVLPRIAEKGLRYDLTVPFARFVVMNQNDLAFPFKRFQIQPVWRADRPQKGRYREFYQCDADIIGTHSDWNEVELTLLIHDVFADLGLQDFVLKVNHREILFALAAWAGVAGQEIAFCATIDKLDKLPAEKIEEELATLGCDAEKVRDLLPELQGKGANELKLQAIARLIGEHQAIGSLQKYLDRLHAFGDRTFNLELDWSLARGLSYYTGMIYEVKPTTVAMGSISGGGRYDNLTGVFGLPGVSGIGISFGLDRIYDVLTELDLFPESSGSSLQLLITHFDETSFTHGLQMLDQLRSEGIAADIYPDQAKIKKQMAYANKIGVPHVITIGSSEIEAGKYSLKNMKTGEQTQLAIDEIIAQLQVHP